MLSGDGFAEGAWERVYDSRIRRDFRLSESV